MTDKDEAPAPDALIARLRQELLLMTAKAQDMEANWSRCSKSCAQMQDRAEKAEAALAERDKDAERWRETIKHPLHTQHLFSFYEGYPEKIIDAIDAALAAQEKP